MEGGVMQYQAKDDQYHWQTTRSKGIGKDSFLQLSTEIWNCQHLGFVVLASRTMRQISSLLFSHLACGT
jgi:hypothetical protein